MASHQLVSIPDSSPDMVYGSCRYRGAYPGNVNNIYLRPIKWPIKIVYMRDVHLVLPDDVCLLQWQAYPTHQDSWLPLWFLILYHTRALSTRAAVYKRHLLGFSEIANRRIVQDTLVTRAWRFLDQFAHSAQALPAAKRFKPLARVVQDILPYIEFPHEIIEDHDAHVEELGLRDAIATVNALRTGKNQAQGDILFNQCISLLTKYEQDYPVKHQTSQQFSAMLVQHHEINLIEKPIAPPTEYIDKLCDQHVKRILLPRLRIFIGGEPHSGKSVFIYLLHRALCEQGSAPVIYRANEDGEGAWANEVTESRRREYRQKGIMTMSYAEDCAAAIRSYGGDVALIDAGGQISNENSVIASACNVGIVLSRSENDRWANWLSEQGVRVIANIRSSLRGDENIRENEGRLEGGLACLHRGRTESSESIRAIADHIMRIAGLPRIQYNGLEYKLHRRGNHTLLSVLKSKWDVSESELDIDRISAIATDGVIVSGEVPTWVTLALVFYFKVKGVKWVAVCDHRLQHECDSVVVFSRDADVYVGSCVNSGQYNGRPHLHTSLSGSVRSSISTFNEATVINVWRSGGCMFTPADCAEIVQPPGNNIVVVDGNVPRWIHARAAAVGAAGCGVFDPRLDCFYIVRLQNGRLCISILQDER